MNLAVRIVPQIGPIMHRWQRCALELTVDHGSSGSTYLDEAQYLLTHESKNNINNFIIRSVLTW